MKNAIKILIIILRINTSNVCSSFSKSANGQSSWEPSSLKKMLLVKKLFIFAILIVQSVFHLKKLRTGGTQAKRSTCATLLHTSIQSLQCIHSHIGGHTLTNGRRYLKYYFSNRLSSIWSLINSLQMYNCKEGSFEPQSCSPAYLMT